MKNGINKLLYEKRLSLGLSTRKAHWKVHISRLELHLIERGYIPIRIRVKSRFIKAYGLPDDFFKDDYRYPEEIFPNKKESRFFAWLDKLFDSFKFRIASWILTAGFIGMAIGGICLNYNAITQTTTYFSDSVLEVRKAVIKENKIGVDLSDSAFIRLVLDKYYTYESEPFLSTPDNQWAVSINCFSLNQNIPYTFFKGVKPYKIDDVRYMIHCESRFYIDNSCRTKMKVLKLLDGDLREEIAYITANTYKGETHKIIEIQGKNEAGETQTFNKGDPAYDAYAEVYTSNIKDFINELTSFFQTDETIKSITSFETYRNDFTKGASKFNGDRIASGCLTIFGAALAILFFALSFVFLFRKNKQAKEDEIESIDFENEIKFKLKKQKKIKKNWIFFPFLPETLIRVLSIILLTVGSIGVYFLFDSIFHFDLSRIIGTATINMIVNCLTIIGIICIFFMKLDIYQNKKSMFLINYSLFFLGLGYYILLLLAQGRLVESEGIISTAGKALLSFVPGNSIWGILAFNILVMFLFYEPKSYKDNPKKMKGYRLLCIIPVAYLLASGILSAGKEYFNWNIPFEIYSLFFSKSTILVAFALAFVFGVYIYKCLIYKRYKKAEADVYIKGNKFFFTKNLIAAVIVMILGFISLGFKLNYPNNPYNFGENWCILFAIPLILLYHPHLGKRIAWFDDIMSVLYGISLYSGVIILALSSLSFLYTL